MIRVLIGIVALAAVAGSVEARDRPYYGGHHADSHGGWGGHDRRGHGRSHWGGHYRGGHGSHDYGHHR